MKHTISIQGLHKSGHSSHGKVDDPISTLITAKEGTIIVDPSVNESKYAPASDSSE
jgi:hypothetical protein